MILFYIILIVYLWFVPISMLCMWKENRNLCFFEISVVTCSLIMPVTVLPLTMIQLFKPSIFRTFILCRLLCVIKLALMSNIFLHLLWFAVLQYISLKLPLRASSMLTNRRKCGIVAAAWMLPMLKVIAFIFPDETSSSNLQHCTMKVVPATCVYIFTYVLAIPSLFFYILTVSFQVYKTIKSSRHIGVVDSAPMEQTPRRQGFWRSVIILVVTIIYFSLAAFHLVIMPLVPGIIYLHYPDVLTEGISVLWTTLTFGFSPGFAIVNSLLHESQRKNFKQYLKIMCKCVIER